MVVVGQNMVGYFKEKNDQIMRILTMVYTNQDLARFIYYAGEDNPLSVDLDDVTVPQLRGMGEYKKLVFPNLKIPNTETDGKILLTITFGDGKNGSVNSLYRADSLKFAIMVHNDATEYEYGLRVFQIMGLIDSMFNNIRIKEISSQKIMLGGYKEFAFSDTYSGYVVTYRVGNTSNSGAVYD